MLIGYALMQFDGGRLDGYGEPPEHAPNRDVLIYVCALIAVPVFVFLFMNLMNSTEAPAGSGFIGISRFAVADGQIAVRNLHRSRARHSDLVVCRKGVGPSWQMMTAAMVLIVFNVFFWTLFEQAGVLADVVRRSEYRSKRIRTLHHLGAPDPKLQPDRIVLLAPVLSWLWTGLAKRGLEPSIPGQVRDRAGRRRRWVPVPGVGFDLRECR